MAPRVSPLTVRSQKKLQFFHGGKKSAVVRSGRCARCTGGEPSHRRERPTGWWAARSPTFVWCALQGDRLEDLAVRLVETELPARQLTDLGELDREAEDRLRDVRLRDLGAD